MIPELYEDKLRSLENTALEARKLVISSLLEAGSGHSAGPLGMADVFTALYFHILTHDPKNPNWPDRDRLLLSNGHICPILYVSLAQSGYFSKEELKTLRKIDSRLQGHPHRTVLPGIENTSGPLGEGIAQSVGIALAGKMDKRRYHVYCVASDGEHQEGNTWEALQLAAKFRLDNLTVIIDRNKIQIDGSTEDVLPLEPFADKYRAFGWEVQEVDGHNIEAIIDAARYCRSITEKPTVIIAHNIPGKGVDFMERDYTWHGKPPNDQEAKEALKQLRTLKGRIRSENE